MSFTYYFLFKYHFPLYLCSQILLLLCKVVHPLLWYICYLIQPIVFSPGLKQWYTMLQCNKDRDCHQVDLGSTPGCTHFWAHDIVGVLVLLWYCLFVKWSVVIIISMHTLTISLLPSHLLYSFSKATSGWVQLSGYSMCIWWSWAWLERQELCPLVLLEIPNPKTHIPKPQVGLKCHLKP